MPDQQPSARPIVMLPEESRAVAALVVGVAAAADFLVALWFFRMGQSS